MTVNSDGTVTSTGDIAPVEPADPIILTLPNGGTLTATYSDENITYNAHVLIGTWMGIGYGTTMTDTDEVIWAAGASTSDSATYDV
jgi:hypothetical protein